MRNLFIAILFISIFLMSYTAHGQDRSTIHDSITYDSSNGYSQHKTTSWDYVLEAKHNKIWTDRSVANRGNAIRIADVMRRAKNGYPVTIGVIGGSITAGAVSTNYAKYAYAPLVYRWWKEKFDNTKVKFVNAGIGATNSIFGVCRVDSDLLSKHPDFVIVEYGVNDRGHTEAQEAYEGLIRKILKSSGGPGILALELMVDGGDTWQQHHLPVVKHYDIPMISYRDALWPAIENQKLNWGDIGSDDKIHPIDRGHAYIAGLILHYLDSVYNNLGSIPEGNLATPSPLTTNGYEKSKVGTPYNMTPVSNGTFEKAKDGWSSSSKGAPIEFKINCGYLWLGFSKTNDSTGASAFAIIDNKHKVLLDADFDGGWGNYTTFKQLIKDKTAKEHTISIYFDDDRTGREFIIKKILIANY